MVRLSHHYGIEEGDIVYRISVLLHLGIHPFSVLIHPFKKDFISQMPKSVDNLIVISSSSSAYMSIRFYLASSLDCIF